MRSRPPRRNGIRQDPVIQLHHWQESIAAPGRYALYGNRVAPVAIRADDVELDLRGHSIAGPGDPGNRDAGVYIEHGRHDVAVVNGRISGFLHGVLADDGAARGGSARVSLQGLTLRGNRFRGALIFATHAAVEQCAIGPTGGTTLFDDAYVMGLELRGDHSRARRTTVFEFYGHQGGESVGICLSDEGMDHCLVEETTVVNARLPATSRSFGIWARNGAVLRGNTLVNLTYAIAPPAYRTTGNTIDNLVIGEQCTEGFFSSAVRGLRTVLVPMAHSECQDCLDKAMALLRDDDALSIVRVASLLEAAGEPGRALEYYRKAADLGSAEAARWVKKLES